MVENRVRKTAVMLNSGPGEVGQAAEGTAPAGPGGTPVSGNIWEDLSPSQAG